MKSGDKKICCRTFNPYRVAKFITFLYPQTLLGSTHIYNPFGIIKLSSKLSQENLISPIAQKDEIGT